MGKKVNAVCMASVFRFAGSCLHFCAKSHLWRVTRGEEIVMIFNRLTQTQNKQLEHSVTHYLITTQVTERHIYFIFHSQLSLGSCTEIKLVLRDVLSMLSFCERVGVGWLEKLNSRFVRP